MRHLNNKKKLNMTTSHRKAMIKNMLCSLFLHEQIVTTLPKAKLLRPIAEKLITLAKTNDFSTKRSLFNTLRSDLAVSKLVTTLGVRYNARPGGYLRIIKAGFRHGDMAPVAVIEFIDRDIAAKGKDYFSADASKTVV